ncbi:MAG: hypothetical protein RTV72_03780 [Candidatus Thorarchaeota archaeon]
MNKRRCLELILTVCLVSVIVGGSIPGLIQNHSEPLLVFEEPKSQKTIIEGVRQYSLSAETTDYVDYSYAPIYGSHTNEPPDGMGQDSNGSAGARTTLTEESVPYNYWTTKKSQSSFPSLPSGWTALEIGYSGGYFQESGVGGIYGGYIYCSTVDTSSANMVSFSLDIGGSWGTDEVSIQFWDGSSWDTMGACATGAITTQTWSSSDSQYQISDFHVQLVFGLFDGSQSFQANEWLIKARYGEEYQAFQTVYRFDTVDYDSYSIEEIYVDYSDGFPSTENLAFRFEAGDASPDNVIKTSNGVLDFSVDVHSYVIGDTCYLDIRDTNRTGSDDDTNSWYIDRVYLLLTEPDPVWVDLPTDQILEYAEPLSYQMNATLTPATHSWWLNDTLNFGIDGNGLIRNTTIVPVETYGIQVSANDTWGRIISQEFSITVQDTVFPVWTTSITNQEEEFGHRFEYIIGAYDVSGIKSWNLDDSMNFTIDSGIITNNTVLEVGTYWLNVSILDNHDNPLSSIFSVFINDTTDPIWNVEPENQFLEYGSDLAYQLDAFDLADISWSIDNMVNFHIDSNGLITNITALNIQTYSVEVIAEDSHGNILSASFDISVDDTVFPIWIISPEYQFSEFGHSFIYTLDAFDVAGISWNVNDTLRFSIDTSGAITNNTFLVVGNFSLQVNATDSHGNTLTGYFTVEVGDTTPPTWNEIPGIQILENGQQFALQLDVTDLAGIAQWIVNDTATFTIDNNGFLTSLSVLNSGTYYIEVTVIDEHGLSSTNVIEIFVSLSTASTTTSTDPNQGLMMMLTIGGIAIGAVVLFASLRTWRAVQKDRLKQVEEGKGEVDTALDYLESIKSDEDRE